MRTIRTTMLSLGLMVVAAAPVRAQTAVPPHPEKIRYPDLTYKLPPPSEFRTTLPNGMVVYAVEDRLLPTFDMMIMLRTGSAVEPPEKAGVASLLGEQLRDGGTKELTPEEFDERVEFLAASMSCRIGETSGQARLASLSKDIDAALELFVPMLRYPRFDEERFRLAKERMLQNIKRRNDSTSTIARIEWGFLMDGEDHFTNRYPSSATIERITRDDLFAFHQRYIHPGNMIVAVAGDFDRSTILKKLERAFGEWPVGQTGPTSFPAPTFAAKPGVYVVQKEDVNQGRVTIGHRSIKRGSPDEFALQIMDGILGAAGFRSRLFARVRSDEGLAYNTGSRFGQGVYYPADFRCWFQSKSNSCAYATKIVLEEIGRLRAEEVSADDVKDAVSYYVEGFPQRFPTKMDILETYVDDEYTGRDPRYWQTYLDNLRTVTPEDVQRVAREHLHPDNLVILAVGDAKSLIAGGYDKAPELTFEAFGPVQRLPLRDPDTLKR